MTLEEEIAQLRKLVLMLGSPSIGFTMERGSHSIYCWCEMRIGNPMVSTHSEACELAQELMGQPE